MERRAGLRITGQLVVGVAIAIVGVLFTLDNLHILRARDYLQFWPLALMAIGLVHIAQARTSAGVIGGAIWILVGAVLLGNRLGLVSVNIWNYWPLLLVHQNAHSSAMWERLMPELAVLADFREPFLEHTQRAMHLSHANLAQTFDLGVIEHENGEPP